MRLQGKRALITGGTSGIGLEAAALFVAEGARVAITGTKTESLEAARNELGEGVLCLKLEMSSMDEIQLAMNAVRDAFGALDVLFLNAGLAQSPSPIESCSEADFDRLMSVNFKGPYFALQKAIPILADGASVVLNASIGAQIATPGFSVYNSSKAALRALARTASAELLPRRIRVNVLSPGPTDTPIFAKGMTEDAEGIKSYLRTKIPAGRMGEPKEIARVALFLASNDSSFMLGQEVVVDGGICGLVF